MTAPTYTAEYMAEVIADELAIAKLLGYGNIVPPVAITPNCWIFGTHGGEKSLSARLATGPLPKWRREWAGAGELIGRCNMDLMVDERFATVITEQEGEFNAVCADHPNKDAAVFCVICKAAIAYLTSERARQNERAPA